MSNNNRRKANGGRRRSGAKLKPTDLWRPVPQLPDPEPIVHTPDPTMIVRSLGDPPLHGQGAQAEHEIARVLVRAAMLAEALAGSVDLLGEPSES